MCLKKVCLIILSFPVFVFAKTDINFSCKKDKESFEILNLENKLQGVYISKEGKETRLICNPPQAQLVGKLKMIWSCKDDSHEQLHVAVTKVDGEGHIVDITRGSPGSAKFISSMKCN